MQWKNPLKVGDKILKINGRTMFIEQDIAFSISEDEDKVVDMVVRRDGKKVSLDNVSVGYVTVTNESGQSEEKYPFAVDVESKNVLSVLKYTALNTLYVGRIVWLSLIQLLTGKVEWMRCPDRWASALRWDRWRASA